MRRFACLAFLSLVSPTLAGAVAVHVPYSGQVAQGGVPLTGTHSITVSLYDDSVRGVPLYSKTESLPVAQGVFHMDLTPDSGLFAGNDSMWAGVTVDAGQELAPRVRVGTVPYAVRALLPTSSPMPGVAFANSYASVDVPGTSTWVPIAQLSMTAPADGYVWLTASGHWQERTNTFPGNYIAVLFILGENTPPSIDQRQQYYSYFQLREWPFSHTTVLPASAGSHTYTLWARVDAIGITLLQPPTFYTSTMQALCVPVSYGN